MVRRIFVQRIQRDDRGGVEGMYGLDVLNKLRELNPKLPVLVVTADIQKSTRDQVKDAGAVGIINKPLKREDLAAAVETVLKGETLWN